MKKKLYEELTRIQEVELKLVKQENATLHKELEEQKIQIVLVPLTGNKDVISLDDLEAYLLPLGRKDHYFDSPELEFDSIILLTKRGFENEFEWIQEQIYFDQEDIEISGTTGKAWVRRLAYINNIPMLLCMYTEKDAMNYTDLIMTGDMVKDLKLRVSERMIIKYRDKFTRYKTEITNLDFLAKKERHDAKKLLRMVKNRLLLIDNETMGELEERNKKEFKIKYWQFFLAVSGWVGVIILAFFV